MPQPKPKPSKSSLTFQIERFSAIVLELRHHADNHWREFGQRQEFRIFKMDWSKYLTADSADRLLTVTARRDGNLIGYLLFFVIQDAHANDTKVSESAFYYTIPHPNRGLLLRGMIRCGVRELLGRGIRFIRFRHRLKQTARSILENLGFELDELSYSLNPDKFRG